MNTLSNKAKIVAGHTPVSSLPWVVADGSVKIRVNDDFEFWLGSGFGGRSGRPRPDLEADRDAILHLAAAAPSLLDALEFVANVARTTPGFSPMALKSADVAIAKAKGGAA